MQKEYNERFPYLKDFETKPRHQYWSLSDLFQNIRNFYQNPSSDELIINLRLDEMKILINDKRFNPKDLGWFMLNIYQVRCDFSAKGEVLKIAELCIKDDSILN